MLSLENRLTLNCLGTHLVFQSLLSYLQNKMSNSKQDLPKLSSSRTGLGILPLPKVLNIGEAKKRGRGAWLEEHKNTEGRLPGFKSWLHHLIAF